MIKDQSEWSKLKKLASNKIIFIKFKNPYQEKMFTIEIEDGRNAPWKPSLFIIWLSESLYTIND